MDYFAIKMIHETTAALSVSYAAIVITAPLIGAWADAYLDVARAISAARISWMCSVVASFSKAGWRRSRQFPMNQSTRSSSPTSSTIFIPKTQSA